MRLLWLPLFFFYYIGSCGNKNKASAGTTPTIVKALQYYNHFPFNFVYTTMMTLGGQQIETVMDTGSSNLLVIGNATLCPGCSNEYGYTSTYTPSTQAHALSSFWSMDFAPIGSASVNGYQDAAQVGGIVMPAYAFGLVVAEQGIPNIWGLAYRQLASPSDAPQTPLFDQMVQTGKMENQFSLRLCGRKTGSKVTLGGFDDALAANLSLVKWTPIQQKEWYSVAVTSMTMQTSTSSTPNWTWSPATSDNIIVDSGTNPLVLPSEEVASLVAVLKEIATTASIVIPDSFWPTTGQGGAMSLTDTQIAIFPPILLTFANQQDTGAPFTLSIASSTYFQTQANGQRFLGVEPGNSIYILGTVFMENYVVLHDRGTLTTPASGSDPTARIGFYPLTGLCQ